MNESEPNSLLSIQVQATIDSDRYDIRKVVNAIDSNEFIRAFPDLTNEFYVVLSKLLVAGIAMQDDLEDEAVGTVLIHGIGFKGLTTDEYNNLIAVAKRVPTSDSTKPSMN